MEVPASHIVNSLKPYCDMLLWETVTETNIHAIQDI